MSSRADIAGMGSKTTTRSGDAAILTGNKTAVIHYPDQVTTHTTKTAVPAGANISSAANGPNLSVVSYSTLFRNADALDWVLISIGTIAALGNGFGFPAFTILFGKFLDKFGSPDGGMKESISMLSVYFIILGAATFAASYLEVTMWTLAAHRQTQRIRGLYLQAVLRQDITFFDTQGSTGGLLMGLNEDCNAIQAGIGEKVGNLLHHMTTFAGGYAVAFCRGWDMTLLMLGAMPLLAAVGAAMATMTSNMEKVVVTSYAQANGIVQQATSQVRTVAAYGGEERVLAEYAAALVLPFKSGSRQSVVSGAGMGAMQLMSFSTFAGAMYYGAWRVSEGDYTGGQVLNVLLAALLGGMSLGMGMPNLPYLAKACTAGARIFNVISRKPNIVDDPKGEAPKQVHGALEMRGVSFAYPTRPELLVFRDLSLTVPAGKTVALVGPSGSGKSTVVQLLQRFYDPAAGQVLLDGTDIRNLRLSWLRSQMGLVSQEPTLFATDIYENIAMGREGATREQVEDAARAANAHSFISALPEGYSTQVGERGVQLSGGQKQRVAIARAILKNPRIMLLDEATSALDTASERLVQAALDKLVVGRTTVVVAHRLSTIRGAHAIAVIQEGRVVELGSHDELIEKPGGAYKMLVKIQMQAGQLEVAPGAPQEDDTDRPGGWMATSVSPNSDSDKNGTQLEKRGSREVQLVVHKQDAKEVAAQEAMALEEAKVPLSRLAALNLPEWWLAALGSLAALVAGGAMTASGLVFASMTTILYLPSPSRVLHEARFYALMFFVIAVAMFISLLVLHSCFGTMGQQLARRVRLMLLKSVIYQEVGWFDLPSHTSGEWIDPNEELVDFAGPEGELVARLSEDSIAIRGAVGDTLAVMLQNIAALVVGYAIAFYYDWRMTLLVTGIFPLLVAAQILQMKSALSQGSSGLDNSFTANQTITDAFSSIRVVQSYNLQGYINKLYDRLLAPSMAAAKKQAHIAGIAMGFTWLVNFGMYSLVVWFGGWEVRHNLSTFDDFFRAFFCVLLAGVAMGQSQAGMTDVGAAQKAVQRVFPLLDRKSRINAADPGGRAADSVAGELTLRDVTFAYPARPIVMVFNRFSLHMPAGKQVALVGESGSGKSTVVGLVQRFYDPQEGVVLLDGVDVRQYNLRWLRSQMGLVSQEPLLFSCSILENIRYGRPDATVEQVEAAARAANAWDFIMAQPDGLNTAVGERGVQLSGGQKQRVAIARAVVRDPRILLLDEATSALDAESEHLVQEALDRIMPGRTTVTVAHRLSTIRNAHMIAVVYRGAVLEQGTHEELMNKEGGAYARLVAAQMKA